jgi:predicted SAM-dependent methyltransferase
MLLGMQSQAPTLDEELPAGLLEERGEGWLHLGGQVRRAGWTVVNAVAGPHVDHVGDIRDLSQFGDATYDMVYASHIIEHLPYGSDLGRVLQDVARLLRPGGRFFVSVPNMVTLCELFVHPKIRPDLRFTLMRMMFGGQTDAFDFHYVGLWDQYLTSLLFGAGFGEVFRVRKFGIFDDTSNLEFLGRLVSLNLVAVRT